MLEAQGIEAIKKELEVISSHDREWFSSQESSAIRRSLEIRRISLF